MKPTFDKQRVYDLLLTIPKGKVITYGQIAELMGNRAWARAVGNALHGNPDGDRYPCHKVVNSCGELSFSYAFGGIGEQKRRLEADGIVVKNGKVDLKQYGNVKTTLAIYTHLTNEQVVESSKSLNGLFSTNAI